MNTIHAGTVTPPRGQRRLTRLRAVSIVIIAFSNSACGVELSFPRRQALDSFVGKDKAAVMTALGEPSKIFSRNGTKLIVYEYHSARWFPGEPHEVDINGQPIGPSVDYVECLTTFRLIDGKVQAWSLSGNDCRDPPYPALDAAMSGIRDKYAYQSIETIGDPDYDHYTARSVVNKGQFHDQ
jgi:hypothetical protein